MERTPELRVERRSVVGVEGQRKKPEFKRNRDIVSVFSNPNDAMETLVSEPVSQ